VARNLLDAAEADTVTVISMIVTSIHGDHRAAKAVVFFCIITL